MSNYRRWMIPGETYFFTVVTFTRRKMLEDERAVTVLGDAIRSVRRDAPFQTVAMVVLPDHLHCIWNLPRGDADFSTRRKRIKREFTIRYIEEIGRDPDAGVSARRRARGERGVWQRRFWEHVVKDEDELESLCDYIHYNPVKHGHASSPSEWPWSTFGRFVAGGDYPPDWGRSCPTSIEKVASIVGE
jgi:putative transposase